MKRIARSGIPNVVHEQSLVASDMHRCASVHHPTIVVDSTGRVALADSELDVLVVLAIPLTALLAFVVYC